VRQQGLKADDVKRLTEYLDRLQVEVRQARHGLLDAMEAVDFRAGWRQMRQLYKVENGLIDVRDGIAGMAPRPSLPASDMAPDLVGDWLRKRETKG